MATIGFSQVEKVPTKQWKFGFDATAITKTRIIVTLKNQNAAGVNQNNLWHDPKSVYQYDKEAETSKYFCVGCYKNNQIKNYAQLIDNQFYAPMNHVCCHLSPGFINAEQARLKKKYWIYRIIFDALSSSTYSFTKPRHQEFSLPNPIMRYMILNPQTSAMYDKLVKSCKWFYGKNKLTLVERTKKTALDDGISFVEASGIFEWTNKDLPLPHIE